MEPIDQFKKTLETSKLYNPVFNFLPIIASLNWYDQKYYECFENLPKDPIFSLANKDTSIWYLTYEQISTIALEFGLNYFLNREKTEAPLLQYQKYSGIVDKLYEEITPNIYKEMGEVRALNLLEQIILAEAYTNAAGWFSVYFVKELAEEIITKTNLNIAPEKLDEIIQKSSDPINGSFDIRSEIECLTFIVNGKNLEELGIAMQYRYAGFNGAEGLDKVMGLLEKDYGDFLQDKSKANEKLEELISELKNKIDDFKTWQSTLSRDEKAFSDYVQLTSTMKDALRDYIGKSITALYRVALPILEEVGIPNLIRFITYKELKGGRNAIIKLKEEIEKRENGFGFILFPNQEPIIFTEDIDLAKSQLADIFLRQSGLDTSPEQKTVKGQPASKGFVTGIVRKILDFDKDSHTMQPGEILVTGMTRPEFVPLMKIAGAIITDEGGITCHAAIVSRELKKPCIIGTKIATQVLKDGDTVEVDADNGVVRIIK